MPGWTAEHEWEGFVPFEELPYAVDPGRGYLVTANDRIHDDDYPHLIGHDFHAPDRAARITELLEERSDHTVETCRRHPGRHGVARRARPLLPRISFGDARARGLLEGWDHDLGAGLVSRRAVGGLRRRARAPSRRRRRGPRRRVPDRSRAVPMPRAARRSSTRASSRQEQLDDALAAAWDRCAEAMGPDPASWRWGDIHRARFTHPLGRMPGLEPLFVAAELPLGGDEQTVNNAGFEGDGPFDVYVVPSWRVVYDLSNLDASSRDPPDRAVGQPRLPPLERPDRPVGGRRAPPAPVHPRRRRGRPPRSDSPSCPADPIARVPSAPCRSPVPARSEPPSATRSSRSGRSGRRHSPRWYGPLVLGVIGLGVVVVVLELPPGRFRDQRRPLDRPRHHRRRLRRTHLLEVGRRRGGITAV